MSKNNIINYNKNPARSKPKPVRLSQCMIVKNEEKNIEKALTWAKGIAFEQIVVDTGSTDRTVEIAERMGASVYHFEWINDFAAAKNCAIEKATGDWIAFLDADEFFSGEDAKKLMKLLQRVNNDTALRKKCLAIRLPWIQVDDEGNPFSVLQQTRIFRNLPDIIRYKNSIHEVLTLPEGIADNSDIGIIHTGYSSSAYKDTDKAKRNLDILEAELQKNPEDVNLKCYLADSLCIEGPTKDMDRAAALFSEALDSGKPILRLLKHRAYNCLIVVNFNSDNKKAEEYCRSAVVDYPDNPDFYFYLGSILCMNQNFKEAWDALIKCEENLKNPSLTSITTVVTKNPVALFYNMLITAEALKDKVNVIRYATLLLKEDKYQKGVLTPYLKALKEDVNTSDEDIFTLLGKLYDLNNTKDKMTILRSAKDAENTFLFNKIYSCFTKDELEWLTAAP